MGTLNNSEIVAVFATADIDGAKAFYGNKLDLEVLNDNTPDGPITYKAGNGTAFSVYLSPDHAGKSTATMASWSVDDLEAAVDELIGNGVTFEQYDDDGGPGSTNEKGIIEFDGGKVAFFRDPDGNTHALNQFD